MCSELLRTALDLSDKQLDEYLEFSERALLVPDDAERRDKSKQQFECLVDLGSESINKRYRAGSTSFPLDGA